MNMGEKIRALRLERGLTLQALGDRVGVGASTVRKWETGFIETVRADKVQKLATALNTTAAYLMGWTDDANPVYKNVEPMPQFTKVPILGEVARLKIVKPNLTENQILFALMQFMDRREGETDQDYRRRIIKCFMSQVYLWDDRIVIFFNISGPDGELRSVDLDGFDQSDVGSTILGPSNPNPCPRVWVRVRRPVLSSTAEQRNQRNFLYSFKMLFREILFLFLSNHTFRT